ncbi:MAG: 5-aminolevulinate synthase [Alphaproteobacteria bacterium]
MNYKSFFSASLDEMKQQGRYRYFANLQRKCGDFPRAVNGDQENQQDVTVWCSNDYLGMGQHPKVLQAMKDAIDTYGAGAGGTRNISGTTCLHVELEREIAKVHGKEAALIFTSGYVANEAALSTLGSKLPDCVIFSDQNNHASMVHGIRSSRAPKHIFKHSDPEDLERLLKQHPKDQAKIVAFESIYSMEGDIAPVEEFVELCEEYNAISYIDEVHGVGLYGRSGGGIVQQLNLCNRLDVIQGTFGKAIGLIGGYIAGSKELIDFVRSYAPGFIFTTALPPAILGGIIASIKHLETSHKEREIHQLRAAYLKSALTRAGIPFYPSSSHIVPIIVGDAAICKNVTDTLMNEFNIYVQPINYPTVPMGTERIRLAPTPMHTEKMIDDLVSALSEIWARLNIKMAA